MLRWIGLTALVAIAVTWGRTAIDLEVYRAAGAALLHGQDLYDASFQATSNLPFVYPPFAALPFSLFALLPLKIVPVVMTVISAAALVTTCVIVARRYQAPVLVGGAVAAASVLLEPLMTNFLFGQINLVLVLLVVADCLLPRTPWPRGLLIGIAAAIKLTPASFLLFFLVRKQRKPILVALGGFVGAGLLTLAVTPGNSIRYWTDVLFQPDRITVPSWGDNQSLRGMLARLGTPDWLWLLMVVLVIAVAWLSVHRLRARGDDVAALLVIAVASLLVSPVSWGHHWSWIAPALVAAVIILWRLKNRWLWAVFAVALVPFALGPHRFLPRAAAEQLGWTPLDHLVGNCYVVIGLVLLGLTLRGRAPSSA
ncbi:glycosyltransferase 87 family protein [Allokutzneria albata]|uniref:Alpha-1,2-mannosyltransferase n=2 Tax=Allokutzneria albata TaxID=211114 RepID=A0A1H0DAG0_ALLAB|nr:glycosyltransferase 87 family protein [Allokutzneria albata]SDN66961.1 alpha-1,2-mannosyltransferase [Allokutzneria albata]